MNTRTYEFAFKMIPVSKEDSQAIASIVKLFRTKVYPEDHDKVTVSYPEKWLITFGGMAPEHTPKLLPCYLTSVAVSVNDSAPTYFEDGTPTETTLSLSFTEHRNPTFDDIS